MRLFLLSLVVLLGAPAWGQVWFAPDTLAVVDKPAAMAAAGGMNTPQISQGDLDGDGLAELIVFDRASQQWQVFKRAGAGWAAAPDLTTIFPHCYNWALLRDYNHDGYADLFTDNRGAIALYRNEPDFRGGRALALLDADLPSTSLSGAPLDIYVTATDVPAILDVDGDGDLDVMTFEFGGVTMELHRNQSITGGTGSLDPPTFRKEPCWGKFAESTSVCGQYFFGQSCRMGAEGDRPGVSATASGPVRPQQTEHVGSTTLPLDADGDGDLDLLIGDVSCANFTLLINAAVSGAPALMGSAVSPWLTAASGRAGSIDLFPAGYLADIDGDGVQDLLAAPNLGSSSGEHPHFARSVYAYRNAAAAGAAPDYRFSTDAFLQEDMIDWGSEAVPCWIDLDSDGDDDLVIGSHDRVLPSADLSSGLVWYRREPEGLVLADTNLLGLMASQYAYVTPFATDLNGDGRADLGVIVPATFNTATAYFIPVNPQAGSDGTALNLARQTTLNFAFLPGDAPAFYDYDNDRDNDMVLGRDDGSLNLVTNTGTPANPAWGALQRSYLGYVSSINYTCKPAVADIDGNGLPDLIVMMGNLTPRLYLDPLFVPGYAAQPDTLFYQNNTLARATLMPFQLWNAPVLHDLDGDTRPDLTIGTGSGGLLYLKNQVGQPLAARLHMQVPAAQLLGNPGMALRLELGQAATVRVLDATGRTLYAAPLGKGRHAGLVQAPGAGLYLVEVTTPAGRATLRWAAR